MRRKSLLAGAIAIVGVLAVGVPIVDAAASTAATSSGATNTTCTFKIYNQTPTQLSGFAFGYVNCSEPFGRGVQSSTYRATVNAKTGAATNKGSYKNWFDDGTVHGTFSLRGQYTSPTAAMVQGHVYDYRRNGCVQGSEGQGDADLQHDQRGRHLDLHVGCPVNRPLIEIE